MLLYIPRRVNIALFDIGVFPSAWYSNVRQIASKSPLLLSMGAEQYLDKELEINHPLKIENIAPVSEFKVFFVCFLLAHMHYLQSLSPCLLTLSSLLFRLNSRQLVKLW